MNNPHGTQVTNPPPTGNSRETSPHPPRLKCGSYDAEGWREDVAALLVERQAWIRKRIALRARHLRARVRLNARGASGQARVGRDARRARTSSPGNSASPASSDDPDPAGDDDEPAKSKDEQTVIVCRARNRKLAGRGQEVWATTAPVALTCLRICPFLDQGCYAQRGPGGHNARLERNAVQQGLDALDLAREEARLIRRAARKLRGKGNSPPIRLHHGGDTSTTDAVGLLLAACRAWPGPVWTYTHAWREVPREAWGQISVLASVETARDVRLAVERGYAPALTVPAFPADGKPWREADIQFIPCPAELFAKEEKNRRAELEAGRARKKKRPRTCFECELCFDADGLLDRRQGIAFEAHGSGKLVAAKALLRARAVAKELAVADGTDIGAARAEGSRGGEHEVSS